MTGIFLMICSSLFACFGQLMWKISVGGDYLLLIIGFFFYCVGALLMIIAYRFGKLSVLQPILALNYVLSILLGHFLLDESITLLKCFGVFIVSMGVYLIATGERE